MKAITWLGLGALMTVALVAIVLLVGWVIVARIIWMPMGGAMHGGIGGWQPWGRATAPWDVTGGQAVPRRVNDLDAAAVEDAFLSYLRGRGYDDLVLEEVMEFEHNYYAIVQEPETGIGAMELLLDKTTGTIGPEVGPNMMWNTAYGMHGGGGMMGQWSGRRGGLTPDEALDAAESWLTVHRPDESPEAHADAFYGYYTIHTVDATGEIVGMLSVHGETGQVWYHTWHGEFVAMIMSEADSH
jgi:hypothetical protein